tara:strand:- start:3328 stop:3540 length:213 start_codon:yes stop_codon:yes gene_type:complete
MNMTQSGMSSNIQSRVQEIIANKLKADQAIIGEDLAAFEQRLGVDYGGDQPATGKFKDELGIHREDTKVG